MESLYVMHIDYNSADTAYMLNVRFHISLCAFPKNYSPQASSSALGLCAVIFWNAHLMLMLNPLQHVLFRTTIFQIWVTFTRVCGISSWLAPIGQGLIPRSFKTLQFSECNAPECSTCIRHFLHSNDTTSIAASRISRSKLLQVVGFVVSTRNIWEIARRRWSVA